MLVEEASLVCLPFVSQKVQRLEVKTESSSHFHRETCFTFLPLL